MPSPSPRNIALVRLGAIGDVLRVLPALDALRRAWPRARLTWFVEDASASLLEGAWQLDELVVIPRKRWRKRWAVNKLAVLHELRAFYSRLARRRFDLVFDFHGNLRSAMVVGRLRGRKLGFARPYSKEGSALLLDVAVRPSCGLHGHKLAWNEELLAAAGVDARGARAQLRVPEVFRAEVDEHCRASLRAERPLVAFHPGVSLFAQLKAWSTGQFAALGDLLAERLGAQILLSWGPGEQPLARAVQAAMRHRAVLTRRTRHLLELGRYFERADVVVAADTGPLHLAAALGRPVVALFGPKDPGKYGPVSAGGVRVAREPVHCSPCTLRRCPDNICMQRLHPEAVYEAVAGLLAERRPALLAEV